eukprot:SM000022S07176  [mRNA]  locus=s22:340681:342323:- [translate_table: standard]
MARGGAQARLVTNGKGPPASGATTANACSSAPAAVAVHEDEWDLLDEYNEELTAAILGDVPSREEAEQATENLRISLLGEGSVLQDEDDVSKPLSTVLEPGASVAAADLVTLSLSQHSMPEQHSDAFRGLCSAQAGDRLQRSFMGGPGSNFVHQAVELLQRDPDMREAVMSLATDPQVWKAFRHNEKVQALIRRRASLLPPPPEGVWPPSFARAAGSTPSSDGKSTPDNVLGHLLHQFNNVVNHMWEGLGDLVSSIFGFVDKKLFGEKASGGVVESTLRTCFILTILVLALVVLRRPVIV